MTIFAVNRSDMDAAIASSRIEAQTILEQVNLTQRRLIATEFTGENAMFLAQEMNEKMRAFVDASYANVDELLRVIITNMNVVVTKLGGELWPPIVMQRETASEATTADAANSTYNIDTDDMERFAGQVDGWFTSIGESYRKIQGTIANGTPGWKGPEKITTVNAVNDAVQMIVAGANGVTDVGTSLSELLRSQATLMDSGAGGSATSTIS